MQTSLLGPIHEPDALELRLAQTELQTNCPMGHRPQCQAQYLVALIIKEEECIDDHGRRSVGCVAGTMCEWHRATSRAPSCWWTCRTTTMPWTCGASAACLQVCCHSCVLVVQQLGCCFVFQHCLAWIGSCSGIMIGIKSSVFARMYVQCKCASDHV